MKKPLLIVLFALCISSIAYSESGWQGDQASDIKTDTTYFGTSLSILDDTVQKALDTLDDSSFAYPSSGIPISNGTAWSASIPNNSTNWNTAYSWGNHSTQGYSKYNFTSNNFNGTGNFNTTGDINSDDIDITGNLTYNDSRGNPNNLGAMTTHWDELSSDTLMDRSRSTLACAGGVLNYTLTAVDGAGTWNFNGTVYPIPAASAVVNLTAGNSTVPQANYINFQLTGGVPTLYSNTTYPTAEHIDVATWLVGAVSGTSYDIYSYNRNRYEVDNLVKRVIHRFEKSGALYASGFVPTVNATTLSIAASSGTPGKFFNGIFEMFSENAVTSASFYYIKNGLFYAGTTLTELLFYSNGDAMSANSYANVVWGIVPTTTTTGGTTATTIRLVAVLQTKPATKYSLADARQDTYENTNYFPSNDLVRAVFVPICRTILSQGTTQFQTFDTGLYYKDLRGKITSGGGAATPTDLSGLVPYTGATGNVNLGVYNLTVNDINATGNMTVVDVSVTPGNLLVSGTLGAGNTTINGTLSANTLDTGQGANELYDMNQNVQTTDAVTFISVDTGQGANELYDMDQNVLQASSPTFANVTVTDEAYGAGWDNVATTPTKNAVYDKIQALPTYIDGILSANTLDTGQGANELYDMDQNVQTTDAVTFISVDTGQGANELYDMDQNVLQASSPTFANVTVTDEAYGAGWDNVATTPTKNAVYDKIQALPTSTPNYSKAFILMNPTATADGPVWRCPVNATITAIHGVQFGGTNITGMLTECDANGANCAVVDSADMVITTSNVNDDGTLSNPSIDINDYVGWNTTSVSGAVSKADITFEYTIP